MNQFPNSNDASCHWRNSSTSVSNNFSENTYRGIPNVNGTGYGQIIYQNPNVFQSYSFNSPDFNRSYVQGISTSSTSVPDSKSKYLSAIIQPNNGRSKSFMNGQKSINSFNGNCKKQKSFLINTNKQKGAQFHCDLCKVPCSDQKALDDHIKGKNHKRREALVNQNENEISKQGSSYRCDVCEVLCSSKDALISHVKGKAHEKQINNLKRLKLTIPQVNYNPITSNKEPCFDPGIGDEKSDESQDNVTKQVVGEEYIEIINCSTTGKFLEYNCKLCECRFSDVNAKNVHLSGKRHHSSFKQKVNPQFSSEVMKKDEKKNNKKNKPKNIKKNNKQIEVRNICYDKNVLSRNPSYIMSYNLSNTYSLIQEDDQIYRRCSQLAFSKQELMDINRMYSVVEEALNNLSKKVVEENLSNFPKIKCIEKIGVLPCGIEINYDTEFDINLILSEYPSSKNLEFVSKDLNEYLSKLYPDECEVKPKNNDSCIYIQKKNCKFSIRLNISSPVCRELNLTSSQILELLPHGPTNDILRKVRRFNWFLYYYGTDHEAKAVIKILRQIAFKIPAWKIFKNNVYLMLLLFHNCIDTFRKQLYPSGLLRRFFEMLASGIVISKSFTIIDPCEREEKNVLEDLDQQTREDITNCAQHALRMMAFNKLHIIIFLKEAMPENRTTSESKSVVEVENTSLEKVSNDGTISRKRRFVEEGICSGMSKKK
uniref:DZF domain-containing protein n=1 Tax=Parastrongyloides trichosuri TaxID=131310 RepID=A0A0N5A531_PARTI